MDSTQLVAICKVSTLRAPMCVTPISLELQNPGRDYGAIQESAVRLVASGAISAILAATYAHVIVDEYQDCGTLQHALLQHVASVVPTCVLGDPMQAIFGFRPGSMPDWNREVCSFFPKMHTLTTPWRWKNVGAHELGEWLLAVRTSMTNSTGIDLSVAPAAVKWIELNGANDHQQRLRAGSQRTPVPYASVLIIADSRNPKSHAQFASQIPVATTVENVDLKDLIAFADLADLSDANTLDALITFAAQLMSNIEAPQLLNRIGSLMRGSARKDATRVEAAALNFRAAPSPGNAANLFEKLSKTERTNVHRPEMLRACLKALQQCEHDPSAIFGNVARRVREELRAGGRAVVGRAVGSTLLLKGLEADLAVILDADAMDARHLYVGMTRGARGLVVCSKGKILMPVLGAGR
jgi:hypothetical protein